MAVRVGIADLAGDLTSRTHGRASAESVRASCASALREEQNRVTTEKWLRSALLMGWLAGGWLLPKENDDDVRE